MRHWYMAGLVLIAACGGSSGGNGGPTDPNPDPDPDPTPTLQSVTCSLDPIADVEYQGDTRPSVGFSWSGQGQLSDGSTTSLDSVVVTNGGTRVQKFTGSTSGSGFVGSSESQDGENSLTATCYRESRTRSASEGFGIYRLVTMSFEAIHFFSQAPNLTGTTVTVTQGTDTRSLTLTDGTGELTVRAGANEVQVQDSDSGQLHYLERIGAPPGEHLVFDRQDIAQPIQIEGNADYGIVSIDDEQFLVEMGRQWNSKALAPALGTINLVLYASGNPTCPDEWTPERDDPAINSCGDTVTWPPGKPFTQAQIDEYLTFVEETKSLLENPIIPWQPYDIVGILADSISMQDYVSSVNDIGLAEVSTRNTLVTIGTGGAPFRETAQIDFVTGGGSEDLWKVFAASETANGNRSFQFSNESRIFGRFRESNPPNCSVADDETNTDPNCPFDDTAPTYYEWDEKAYAVMATYLARAQSQPVPFNVRLPEP